MARIDVARRRLLLTASELDVAVALRSQPDDPALADPEVAPVLRSLEEGGILREGRMADAAAELLDVLAQPALEVVMETFVAEAVVATVIWGTPARMVLATNPEFRRWVLSPLEPGNLPFAMATVLGLGARPPAPASRPLALPGAALRDAWASAAAGDSQAARAALDGVDGLEPAERDALAALVSRRRQSWRVTATWNESGGVVRRGTLAVVDGGPAGMWETAPLDPDRPQAGVLLTPQRATEVWARLRALVPPPAPVVRDLPAPAA